MKIRNGFVSNSSSSSFCILGCELTDDIEKKLRVLAKKKLNSDDVQPYYKRCYKDKNIEDIYIRTICDILSLESYTEDQTEYGDIVGVNVAGCSIKVAAETEEDLKTILGDCDFTIMSDEYYS